MNRWATIDRDKLIDLRNERSTELRALGRGSDTVKGFHDCVKAASLEGTIEALDCIIEATRP